MKTFKINEEYIQLDQLLKALRIANSGGMAHLMVDDGMVKVNGFVETRRRAKIRAGDIVDVEGVKVKVITDELLGD